MAAVTLLSTSGLSRQFGGLKAVDQVDFAIREGEIRALIGPNGAGKTTFVSLLSGRITPSAGRITFAGEDITAMPAHRRVRQGIAYTFQITSVYPTLTAFENVALPAQTAIRKSARGNSKRGGQDAITERAMAALSGWGLANGLATRRAPFPMAISGFSKWRWGWRSNRGFSFSTSRRRDFPMARSIISAGW